MSNLRNSNQIFEKGVAYDTINIHKKSRFHPLSRKHIFGKTPMKGSDYKI